MFMSYINKFIATVKKTAAELVESIHERLPAPIVQAKEWVVEKAKKVAPIASAVIGVGALVGGVVSLCLWPVVTGIAILTAVAVGAPFALACRALGVNPAGAFYQCAQMVTLASSIAFALTTSPVIGAGLALSATASLTVYGVRRIMDDHAVLADAVPVGLAYVAAVCSLMGLAKLGLAITPPAVMLLAAGAVLGCVAVFADALVGVMALQKAVNESIHGIYQEDDGVVTLEESEEATNLREAFMESTRRAVELMRERLSPPKPQGEGVN